MERIKHARRLIRAASARAAGIAGTDLLRMYNMLSTNIMPGGSQLVVSISSWYYRLHQGNLVPGAQAPSPKPEVPSCKPQAASPKLQASSLKNILERSLNSFPRYSSGEDIFVALGP